MVIVVAACFVTLLLSGCSKAKKGADSQIKPVNAKNLPTGQIKHVATTTALPRVKTQIQAE